MRLGEHYLHLHLGGYDSGITPGKDYRMPLGLPGISLPLRCVTGGLSLQDRAHFPRNDLTPLY